MPVTFDPQTDPSEDLQNAFSHPAQRIRTSRAGVALDRISVRDHVVEAEIGAFESERGVTQRLRFNVVVEVGPVGTGPGADPGDDVDCILSYDDVTEAITAALGGERLNLLETLAERVAARVLRLPNAVRTFVRVEKLDRGPAALGVEIERRAAPACDETRRALAPLVAFLTNRAIATPGLGDRIAGLLADPRPLVLCVGPQSGSAPTTDRAPFRQRIDLLAIEQAAWALAARDARFTVAASRTELEWAMREGLVSIWAPSKIVLATTGDVPPAHDPVALAEWFAGLLGASGLMVLDAPDTALQAL